MASSATETETVRALHILIKHEGSRRKASWKDPDGRVISATTRADAAARLADLRDQILSGRANFADLAARHSDCSSARRGGDLGASPDLISLSLRSTSWPIHSFLADLVGVAKSRRSFNLSSVSETRFFHLATSINFCAIIATLNPYRSYV
jgi:NIMA-interacting peptidyl-prolyl cis-trans isomerase 1